MKAAKARRVFIGNIPFDATEQELIDLCQSIGPVVDINIPPDKAGKNKGFVFVDFPNSEMALAAIRNLNGDEIRKRQIRVNFTSSESNANLDKKDEQKVKLFFEGLTPQEKLFLTNQLGYALENQDPTLIAMLVRNPKLIDMIHNLQEEVKALLEKPELITQGSRDPFARNYSSMADEKTYTSIYYPGDEDGKYKDGNGNDNKSEVPIDPLVLSKLTFKEIMELDRLRKMGMAATTLASKLEEGLKIDPKEKVLNELLSIYPSEKPASNPNNRRIQPESTFFSPPHSSHTTPEPVFKPQINSSSFVNPQTGAYQYHQPQPIPQHHYVPAGQMQYPMGYPPQFYPGGRPEQDPHTQRLQIMHGMHPGVPVMPPMGMPSPYMMQNMYTIPRPPPPQTPHSNLGHPGLIKAQPESRSSFQKPPNPFITRQEDDKIN